MRTVYAPWHSPWPWGPEHWAQSEHKGSLRSLRQSRAAKDKDKGNSPGLEPGQDRLLIFSVELLLAPEFFLCGIFSLTAVVWDAGVWEERETSKNKQKNGLQALGANGMGTNLTSGS